MKYSLRLPLIPGCLPIKVPCISSKEFKRRRKLVEQKKSFRGDIVYDYGHIILDAVLGHFYYFPEKKLRQFCIRYSLRKNRTTQKPRYLKGKILVVFKIGQPKPLKIFMKAESLYLKEEKTNDNFRFVRGP